MATVNDEAWTRYLAAKQIHFDQPTYSIDATELKELAGREPRLLAKFDTPDQLPQPFKDSGYTLLPVKNGRYLLLRGNLFIEIPDCSMSVDFVPTLPFPLATAGRGSGESQYIDQAFNTGLLARFLSLRDMYLTIRGREYTGRFEFQLNGITLQVESVQIEVDAGYEALHDIVLIEAKIGVPKYFNVRQLYYPYRHFSALAAQKRVRNVFLAYDIPSASYHLYEYDFRNLLDPHSANLKRCAVYKVGQPAHLTIHDLIDARFQSPSPLVPQADDLNKIYELLTLVDAGLQTAEDVADYFVFERRQSSYYREAAEYLGLITSSRQSGYRLTDLGIRILSTPPSDQARVMAKTVVNSWIFVELFRRSGAPGLFTDRDIDEIIKSAVRPDGTQHYSGSTVSRRRQTIVAWIRWLADEIGCFSLDAGTYRFQ